MIKYTLLFFLFIFMGMKKNLAQTVASPAQQFSQHDVRISSSPSSSMMATIVTSTQPQQIQPSSVHSLEIVNSSDFPMDILYTTTQGININDTIKPKESKRIWPANSNVLYSLSETEGKVKSGLLTIPVEKVEKGVFQMTPEAATKPTT